MDEEVAQVLHVRFARRVAYRGRSTRADRGEYRVLGTRDGGLVQEDVGAAQLLRAQLVALPRLDLGTELPEGQEVGVEPPAPDHVAAGRRKHHLSTAGQQRTGQQDGGPDAAGQLRVDRTGLDAPGIHAERVRLDPVDSGTEVPQQLDHREHVPDFRHVLECDGSLGEHAARQDRQGAVLVSGRPEPPLQVRWTGDPIMHGTTPLAGEEDGASRPSTGR